MGYLLAVAAASVALVGCGGKRADGPPPVFVERIVAPRRAIDGTPPPLLVLLHGIGSNENDLVSLAGKLDPRFLVVSLRAPRPYRGGFAWFQITWQSNGSATPDIDQAHETLADFVRWLAAAPGRLGADARRVYLMGFSQGAMMSLGVLRTAPDRLAGVVALSGLFRDDLVETPADAGATGRVAVFVAHGTQDDLLPVADGRAIRDLLQPMVRDFTYREYAMPHTIAPVELRDVAAWLTSHLDR